MVDNTLNALAPYIAIAKQRNHRACLNICGDEPRCLKIAGKIVSHFTFQKVLIIGNHGVLNYPSAECEFSKRYLGHEFDCVIYNLYSGLDVDAIGALGGTIRGGGLFILLSPPRETWKNILDPQAYRIAAWPYTIADVGTRMLQHMSTVLNDDTSVITLETLHDGTAQLRGSANPNETYCEKSSLPGINPPYRTPDQQSAVEKITARLQSDSHAQLTLVSDRGRGKTTALALVASLLIKSGAKRILITAPRRDVTESFFTYAANQLPGSTRRHNQLLYQGSELRFYAPDELLLQKPQADILLVDEAAAIPSPLLETLMRAYPRVVYATTLHGYEGSGRGFAIRFMQILKRYFSAVEPLHLFTPVRWNENDPLEQLIFKLLLLDASPFDASGIDPANIENVSIELLSRDDLLHHTRDLREMFGLLISAHYQTKPSDLRHLLDGVNIKVLVIRMHGHIVATALVEEEGSIDVNTAQLIYANRRRVRGHMLPQTLCTFEGFAQACTLRYWRIVRIAVIPELQRRGLGRHLVNAIMNHAQTSGVDIIGTHFGATADLVTFWQALQFRSAHIGIKRNAASGAHAITLLRGLTPAGIELCSSAHRQFSERFPILREDVFSDLEIPLTDVIALLPIIEKSSVLHAKDIADITSFANSNRGYELNSVPIRKLVALYAEHDSMQALLSPQERCALNRRVIQRQAWREAVKACAFSGKHDLLRTLRQAVNKIIQHYLRNH